MVCYLMPIIVVSLGANVDKDQGKEEEVHPALDPVQPSPRPGQPVTGPVDRAADGSGRSNPDPRLVPTGSIPGAPGAPPGHRPAQHPVWTGWAGPRPGPTGPLTGFHVSVSTRPFLVGSACTSLA
jgi:hypothetical protein